MKQIKCLFLFFGFCCLVSLQAKSIPVSPPQPITIVPRFEDPASAPLRVRSGNAEVRISGVFARTVVTYTVENPNPRALEAEFKFPLPPGATVTGLALDVEEQMIDAAILPKAKAKTVFDAV